MAARIKDKRKFFYWFIPLTLLGVWGLTFSVPTYFSCSTSLSTEGVISAESNRAFTLNRPENFDLGLTAQVYSIDPDDYAEITGSTEFLCRVLATPVMTKDSSFCGSYYEYLVTHYRYSWLQSCKRLLHGTRQPQPGEPLPALDPFYPKGVAAEAISLAGRSISCDVDRHTQLTTISVNAQDPLVAALVAQSAADNLKRFNTEYLYDKSDRVFQHLQDQMAGIHAEYKEALLMGDEAYAAMLSEAYDSFQRQAIIFSTQLRYMDIFTTLNNVTVPRQPAGPHHLLTALLATVLATLLAMLCICRRELFGAA